MLGSEASWRKAHTRVLRLGASLQEAVRRPKEAGMLLTEWDQALSVLWERQDASFYAALRRACRSRYGREGLAESLEVDLRGLRVAYGVRIRPYLGCPTAARRWRRFPVDFMSFWRELRTRVQMEEDHILPLLAYREEG